MFTGIVEAIGTVRSATRCQGDLRLCVNSGLLDLSDVKLGDSIATNGVCLTVVEIPGYGFIADVSIETLDNSTLGDLTPGAQVNLEKALTPTTRLGGHLVSGHVDGRGTIVAIEPSARSTRYWVEAPIELARFIAQKGSIAVDGISLTVNEVESARFALNIVPHTQEVTTVKSWKVGHQVNLEVDQIARYLERLLDPQLQPPAQTESSPLTTAFLAEHGFMR